ncbi:MAG: hypothetical protein U0930_18875 [Pirellulales bacterium]
MAISSTVGLFITQSSFKIIEKMLLSGVSELKSATVMEIPDPSSEVTKMP